MKNLILIALFAGAVLTSCEKCHDFPPKNDACADIYDPVCANGKTYGNECEAKRAGETSWTKGECIGPK